MIKIIVFSTALFLFLLPQQAYAAARFYLVPETSSFAVGQNFVVEVRFDTGEGSINAAQADISFPKDKLEVKKIIDAESALSISAESKKGDGEVAIGRGNLEPVKGDKLLAKIEFEAKAPGEASLDFKEKSGLADSKNNKNILTDTKSGKYTLTGSASISRFTTNQILLLTTLLIVLVGVFLAWKRIRKQKI